MKEIDWQLLLWLVFRSLDIPNLILNSKKHLLHIFANISFSSPPSGCCKLFVYFRKFFCTTITQMSLAKRNETISGENCGAKTRRSIVWRYTRCSTGTLHFIQCPDFPTTSQTYRAQTNKLQNTLDAIFTLVINHYSLRLLLSVGILQIWPVRIHIVLLSSSVVQVGRVNICIWKRFPVTG